MTLEEHARAIEAAIKAAADEGLHLFDDSRRPLARYGAYLEGLDAHRIARSRPVNLPRDVTL